jgi:PAS domain S-box-containing protein
MKGRDALHILVIEDQESDFLLVERFLARKMPSTHFRRVASRHELDSALSEGGWDIVLSDYSVPGMDFNENLDLILERTPNLPVILLSGSVGDEQAVSLVKKGVWDFVLKDNLIRLPPAIERSLQEAAERRARTEAETSSREAESALRTLVNAIPESAILTDIEGTILAANETIARRYGKLARQLIGVKLRDLFPSEVAESRMAHVAESIRTGEPLRFGDRRFGRYIDNYVHPIKDESGQVKRLAVLGIDVTEHKEAEEKLSQQAALLDIASDAIMVKDLDSRILYWSKGAERIYGWTAEEAWGKETATLLFSEAYSAEAAEAWKITVETGRWHGDLHQRTKSGTELIIEGRWTLMHDEKGGPRGTLSVNTDVTQHRSTQAQLLRSQRLESLGTLAGGIAHDLNNVLSPILMGVEGLSFHNQDVSSQKILEIIKASAQRGANIVRQILNFARGMEGKRGEVQVKHVLREIEGIARETFDRSIVLQSDFPRDLWPVIADATQLHQVLMNLCLNARDAMPEGGDLTISAANVTLDETYAKMNIEAKPIRYVMLKVEDTGTGMPPRVLEKIFDPFFSTKPIGKGSGLGLATVRTIVQSHGGFTNVYSHVGKGTSFKVYIPAAELGSASPVEAPPEETPAGAGELVLVVEDEVSLRDITRQILESYGYRVLLAVDGTDALVQFLEKQAEIRLVITDMMMPYMDGAATIRAIRKVAPETRIIATSGLMVSEYAREANSLGVQAFLAKPYTAETLLRTIRDVLTSASISPSAPAPAR